MVIGLVDNENTMAIGKFILNNIANAAELSVCIGKGIKAQNIPIAAPPADERL